MKLVILLVFLSLFSPVLKASQQHPSCCEAFFCPPAVFLPCAYIQPWCCGYRPVWTRSWINCAPFFEELREALDYVAENFTVTCCMCTNDFPADVVWYSTCCNYQRCQECMSILMQTIQQERGAPAWLRCNNCQHLLDLKSLYKALTGKNIDDLTSDSESIAGSVYTWLEPT